MIKAHEKIYNGHNIDFQTLPLEVKRRDSPVMKHFGFYDLKVLLDSLK